MLVSREPCLTNTDYVKQDHIGSYHIPSETDLKSIDIS